MFLPLTTESSGVRYTAPTQFGLSCNSPPPAGVLLGVAYALSLPADEPLRLRAVAGDEAAFESLLRPWSSQRCGWRSRCSGIGGRRGTAPRERWPPAGASCTTSG